VETNFNLIDTTAWCYPKFVTVQVDAGDIYSQLRGETDRLSAIWLF